MTTSKPTTRRPLPEPRKQVETGLTVYPICRADGSIVWITVPKSR